MGDDHGVGQCLGDTAAAIIEADVKASVLVIQADMKRG